MAYFYKKSHINLVLLIINCFSLFPVKWKMLLFSRTYLLSFNKQIILVTSVV